MVEVPVSTEAADAAFVTAALREGGVLGSDSAVAEVSHETIGEGVGIVGQLALGKRGVIGDDRQTCRPSTPRADLSSRRYRRGC